MEVPAMNGGRTTPPTVPRGKWPTSAAVQATAILQTKCFFLSETPSIL